MTVAALATAVVLAACGGTPQTLPVTEETVGTDQVEPTTATLPADWPSDIPTPTGLTLVNAIKIDAPEGPTWSGTWQGGGDAGQVYDEIAADLTANGFTDEGGLGGTGSGEGGITTFTKGGVRLQLTVMVENGQVVANITALDQTGS